MGAGREARAGERGAGQGRLAPAEPLPRRWAGRGRRLLGEACSSGVPRRDARCRVSWAGGSVRPGSAWASAVVIGSGVPAYGAVPGAGILGRELLDGLTRAGNSPRKWAFPHDRDRDRDRDRGAGPLTQTPKLRPGDRAAPSRQHECGARTPVSGPARLLPASQAGGGLLTPPLLRRRSREASEPGSAAWLDRVGWWCERKAGVPGGAAGGRRLRLAGLPRGGRALYGPGARWPLPSVVEGVGCFSVTGSAPGDFRVRMRNWPYGVWCGEMRW